MPYCKYPERLVRQGGSEFDDLHLAGTRAPLSGLYRCAGCEGSVVARNGALLPPADHHVHPDGAPVEWRLIVRSHWS